MHIRSVAGNVGFNVVVELVWRLQSLNEKVYSLVCFCLPGAIKPILVLQRQTSSIVSKFKVRTDVIILKLLPGDDFDTARWVEDAWRQSVSHWIDFWT